MRRSSLDLPGGSVRSESGEILLRTIGQAYRGDEYESIVLLTRADGTRLLLGDVATVVDGFAETDQSARFDLAPTVLISVFRTGGQSALEIADRVYEYVERTQPTLPEGISLTVWQDAAEMIDSQLGLMIRTGLTGFALVFLLLSLFLELRLAFWVSLGIPISFLGAIMLMPAFGVTINFMSLFAFILVLGVVVGGGWRPTDGVSQPRTNGSDAWPVGVASRRGADRALALAGSDLYERATRQPVAGNDWPDP